MQKFPHYRFKSINKFNQHQRKNQKKMTSKDQYVAQRARGAYIATVSQPEIAFDLSFAAQVTNSKNTNMKFLNKRIQWQIDNSKKSLRFVKLDKDSLNFMIFTDSSFVNNLNFFSQISFVIALVDANKKINNIH